MFFHWRTVDISIAQTAWNVGFCKIPTLISRCFHKFCRSHISISFISGSNPYRYLDIFWNFPKHIREKVSCTRDNHTNNKSLELKHAKSALGSGFTVIMGANLRMASRLKSAHHSLDLTIWPQPSRWRRELSAQLRPRGKANIVNVYVYHTMRLGTIVEPRVPKPLRTKQILASL